MPQQLEHKNIGVSGGITGTNDEEGIVEALVSVTGIVDNVNDIIEPGAYTKTLSERAPKGVWSHDWNTPVSKALAVEEWMPGDPRLPETLPNGKAWPSEAGALWVKAQFNLNTQRGRDAYADVKFYEDQCEWSIGYKVPKGKSSREEKTGIRRIQELQLFEFSPVLFGAASNARSLVRAAKALYDSEDEFLTEVKSVLEHEKEDVEEKAVEEVVESTDDPIVDVKEIIAETEKKTEEETSVDHDLVVTAENIKQIKALHDQLGSILELLVPEQKQVTFADYDVKDISTVVKSLDSDKLPEMTVTAINDTVEEFKTALASENVTAIRDAANEVLDEVTFALSENKDDAVELILKDIAASVGLSLENYKDEEKSEEVVVDATEEEHKTIEIDADELKSLFDF